MLGLLALMLHAEARRAARRDPAGEFVPLGEQHPQRWDGALIAEAETLLLAASRMQAPARFQLEAAVQSAHASRRTTGRTDWPAPGYYDVLVSGVQSLINGSATPTQMLDTIAKPYNDNLADLGN